MRKILLSLLATVLSVGSLVAADLSITAGSVIASSQATVFNGTAGATITAGQVVYRDTSTNTIKLADADASAATAAAFGIALNGASTGQPVRVVTADPALTVGGTLSLTAPVYVLSGTAGGIAPIADLAAGDYPVVLLVATSTSVAIFNPTALAGTTVVASP